jgi:hypothetical protein
LICYERVSWETPEKKFAAKLVNLLYEESDSPLRYRINRLGGRSRQEKWILQSEVFNELFKVVQRSRRFFDTVSACAQTRLRSAARLSEGGARGDGRVWGDNEKFMFTRM